MNCCQTEEALSKKIFREFISDRYPEYLPYFELIWKNRDQPVRIKKTRGAEELLFWQILIPFLVHFSAIVVSRYLPKKAIIATDKKSPKDKGPAKVKAVKPPAGGAGGAMRGIPQENIDAILNEARSKFPGLSEEDYLALEKNAKKVLKDGL